MPAVYRIPDCVTRQKVQNMKRISGFLKSKATKALIILATSAFFGKAFSLSLTEKCATDSKERYPSILEVIKDANQNAAISWRMNSRSPQLGSEVEIVRCLPPGKFVSIGTALVQRLNGTVVEGSAKSLMRTGSGAAVETGGKISNFEIESGNSALGLMVGDFVVEKTSLVQKLSVLTPKIVLDSKDLFEKNSKNFELTFNGKEKLRKNLEQFQSSEGVLLVESRVNLTGDRQVHQFNSNQQAYEVAQFLRAEIGGRIQVEWIGFGSNELTDGFVDSIKNGDENITLRMVSAE
jgi:hypothetical protein